MQFNQQAMAKIVRVVRREANKPDNTSGFSGQMRLLSESSLIMVRITGLIDEANGVYSGEQVFLHEDETASDGMINTTDLRTFDADLPLHSMEPTAPVILNQVVYAFNFGGLHTYSAAASGFEPYWMFHPLGLLPQVNFMGLAGVDHISVLGGNIVTPDGESAVAIAGDDFVVTTSYDTWVFLTGVLDKTTGSWTVSTTLESDTSCPVQFTETDDEISINWIIGSIESGVWVQWQWGDWYIPFNIFQAVGFDLGEVQIPAHGAAGTLYWLATTDSCEL